MPSDDSDILCRFGQFTFDPRRGALLDAAGAERPLRRKSIALLQYLLAHPNRLLPRSELMNVIWPGVFVTDDSLTHLVREIRHALDDKAGILLRTVSGRGYLFAPPVSPPREPAFAANAAVGLTPHPTTSFVGRARELAAVRAQMRAQRLVTITGMGGVGKTRLLTRLASELANETPDLMTRLFRVDLAPVTAPSGVAEAVANAVGGGSNAASPREAVIAALRNRRAVLVIDNAEHVAREAGTLLEAILAECPGVAMLVTSRVSLGVPGESVFRLEPLPLPPEDCQDSEEALRFDAIRLFADRAAMAPGFGLDATTTPSVVAICRQLDGIALAIEMAVPRLQVLTPAQLLERLGQRFDLLAGRVGASPRQRSLRAMLDWSWELLAPPERELLLELSIFTGGASLSALVAMRENGAMSAPRMTEGDVLDGLTELVRASLVIADTGGPEPRYRLLETTRAFALDQMDAAAAEARHRRHLTVLAETFERAEADWPTAQSQRWIARYGPDADNLRAALYWAFGPDRPSEQGHLPRPRDVTELGLRLVAVSYPLWWELPTLPLRESRSWFDRAVARIGPDTPLAVQARLWLGHSWRDIEIGDVANRPAADRAVALFRALGDPVGLGAALWRSGSSVLSAPRFEALPAVQAMFEEAERVLRTGADTKWLALTLIRRADTFSQQGDLTAALALYDKAWAMARQTGHWLCLMLAGTNMADLLFQAERPEEAATLLWRLREELPRGPRAPLISVLAAQLAAADRRAEALEMIWETVDEAPPLDLRFALARGLEALAMLLAEAGDIAPATRLFGFVLAVHPATRNRRGGRHVVYQRLKAAVDACGAPEEIAAWLAEGAAWSEQEAVEAALSHKGFRR